MEQPGTMGEYITSESESECISPVCNVNACAIGGSINECCRGDTDDLEPLPPTPEENNIVHTVIDAIEDAEESPLFKGLLAKVKSRATSVGISVTTVTTVLKYSMEVVELSDITGSEQRELALDLVKRVIDDANMSNDTRAACDAVIESGILIGVIDLVVDATKGKLSINAVQKKAKRCLKGFGCISGGN